MLRPRIFQVRPNEDFTVNVYFDDGKIKLYDAKQLISKGGIFAQLGDAGFFNERCSVMNHTLAWDIGGNFDPTECIDICPDIIYTECEDIFE